MIITEEKREDIVILGVNGRLDFNTSPQLDRALDELYRRGERHLVIDFSDLDYISSSGLEVLLVAAKKVLGENGKLALCCLKDEIKQIFDITNFSSIFPIFPSRETAINDLLKERLS